jgi:hypothetical protein
MVLLAIAVLLAPASAFAQSSAGTISGKVMDENGAALPGVTAEATSAALQGQKLSVTDAGGNFRLVALPPGAYTVTFSMDGFQNVVQEDIRVNIGGQIPLVVTMNSAFTDTMVVTSSDRPLVNTQSTESGVSLSSDFFQDLPTGRNYASVARVAPGAQDDASGTTFYGSTGAENAYYIDGVNTTGVELGQQGKNLNFEFIQEVQVKTGSYGAEYGRNTGGIIEVVTKSGGNELTGDVFGYYDDDSLESSLSTEAAAGGVSGSTRTVGRNRSDLGFDLGGAFQKDKLWYFVAYDQVDNTDDKESVENFAPFVPNAPGLGDQFQTKTTRDLAAAKLTWKISPTHTLAGSFFDDSGEQTGLLAGYSLAAPPSHFTGVAGFGAPDYALNYDGVLSESVLISGRLSQHNEENTQTGAGADLVGFIDQTDPLGDGTITWGWAGAPTLSGFGFFQNQEFTRDQTRADVTYFVNDFGGDHEFKIGAELEDVGVINANRNSGGSRVYRFPCSASRCPNDPTGYYYRHRYFVQTKIDPYAATAADLRDPLTIDTKAENEALFLQDSWRVADNFTLNLGVRHDTQSLFNAAGQVQQKLDDGTAPRLGFIWDPMKNGRSKVYAHYGKFYETIPMDIVIRSYGGEITVFAYNFSQNPADLAGDRAVGRGSSTLGGGFSNVDPGTESQHIEELVIGGEYEVTNDMSVGVKYINRDLKNIMEDALSASGDYFIGNPGRGLMTGTYDIGYAFGYNSTLHALPVPTRKFEGYEVTLTKRPTKNFQFLASLLFSELTGSYDGLFQASTGQLDPNLNSAFDYYDFSVNNKGKLSNDRPFQAKIDGAYNFGSGVTVGASAYYRDGVPVTAMGYSDAYANWEYYLSERGAFGRTDTEFEADVHVGYPIALKNGAEINLLLDVFNLLDRQGETGRSNRYDLNEDYQPIDWFTGVEAPPITPGDATRPPTNASFNTANAWQNPRSVRLGVRFSF